MLTPQSVSLTLFILLRRNSTVLTVKNSSFSSVLKGNTNTQIYIKVGSFRASFFLFKSPTASTTAKREERGGGLFFGERDRQTRFEIRSRRFFFSLHFPSRCRMYH